MAKASTQYKREHKIDFGRERIDILYEDAYIVVIHKPSGMLSVPYPGSKARTALDVLCRLMRSKGTYSQRHRPFVVHRLDRDTSGVMLFALSEQVQRSLMGSWQKVVSERIYRAVAENPKESSLPESGVIDAPLAYNAYNIGFVPKADDKPSDKAYRLKRFDKNKTTYAKHLDFSGGKAKFKTVEARTRYRIVERGATHTLFELNLDTGKKNQIRAHLASKGYPFCRLALHARTIEFVHPATHKTVRFEVPEPEAWLEYVRLGDERPALPVWRKKRETRDGADLPRDFAASQKGGRGGAVHEKNNN